jgi:hypothetical protein
MIWSLFSLIIPFLEIISHSTLLEAKGLQVHRFLYLVVVPSLGVPTDQVAYEPGEEQLCTDDHHGECDIEIG